LGTVEIRLGSEAGDDGLEGDRAGPSREQDESNRNNDSYSDDSGRNKGNGEGLTEGLAANRLNAIEEAIINSRLYHQAASEGN
jgi:hypothetical protein